MIETVRSVSVAFQGWCGINAVLGAGIGLSPASLLVQVAGFAVATAVRVAVEEALESRRNEVIPGPPL